MSVGEGHNILIDEESAIAWLHGLFNLCKYAFTYMVRPVM